MGTRFGRYLRAGIAQLADEHEPVQDHLAMTLLELPSTNSLLHVGCGRGETTRELAKMTPDEALVYGVESSWSLLRRASCSGVHHENPIVWIRARTYRLPLPTASFETVYCSPTPFIVDDPDAVLAELVRVCEPNGTLVISAVVGERVRTRAANLVGKLMTDFQLFDTLSLSALLSRHGLSASETHRHGTTLTVQTARS